MKKSNKLLKYLAILLYSFLVIILAGYVSYSIVYVPTQSVSLLNAQDSIYQVEDLKQTNNKEGEIRQFANDWLMSSFSFNYINFVSNDDYKKIIKKEIPKDLPDKREELKEFYTDKAYKKVLFAIENSGFLNNFWKRGGETSVYINKPPKTVDLKAFDKVLVDGERRTMIYDGYFYVNIINHNKKINLKEEKWRVDYTISLRRKTVIEKPRHVDYFFKPLLKKNMTEWIISDIELILKRKG